MAEPPDEEAAAQRLYDLALSFQERSQRSEARLLDEFADVSTRLSDKLGDVIIVDDDDERLVLNGRRASGPRSSPTTPTANGGTSSIAEELVEFYDPTDVFGDLADALAEAFPSVAPELEAGEADDDADGGADEVEAAGRGRRRRPRPGPTPPTPTGDTGRA